jgi:CheY-like chemotaxis protein
LIPDHRVLVIDDDEMFRLLISRALVRAGYDTLAVSDGLAALDAVESYQPDAIFLDMYLPMLDGWEFLRKYRERTDFPKPIIASSASNVDPDSLGDVIEFFQKPFDFKLFLKEFENLFPSASGRV